MRRYNGYPEDGRIVRWGNIGIGAVGAAVVALVLTAEVPHEWIDKVNRPTAQASPNPGLTPQPSMSPSPEASPTQTPTPSPSVSPSMSPSMSPRPSATPKESISPKPNVHPTPSPSSKVANKPKGKAVQKQPVAQTHEKDIYLQLGDSLTEGMGYYLEGTLAPLVEAHKDGQRSVGITGPGENLTKLVDTYGAPNSTNPRLRQAKIIGLEAGTNIQESYAGLKESGYKVDPLCAKRYIGEPAVSFCSAEVGLVAKVRSYNNHAQLIFQNIPAENPKSAPEDGQRNRIIQDNAERLHYRVFDAFRTIHGPSSNPFDSTQTGHSPLMSSDGYHPTAPQGYQTLDNGLYQLIDQIQHEQK